MSWLHLVVVFFGRVLSSRRAWAGIQEVLGGVWITQHTCRSSTFISAGFLRICRSYILRQIDLQSQLVIRLPSASLITSKNLCMTYCTFTFASQCNFAFPEIPGYSCQHGVWILSKLNSAFPLYTCRPPPTAAIPDNHTTASVISYPLETFLEI